ncbi:MAG: ABC transporter ATP-binding protein [Thermomicrobiales bacterium]
MNTVRFEAVTKLFEGQSRAAVSDLSLDVADGELLVMLGPSGCGKTTALRMLAGLEEPDEGDILIGGRSVVGLEPRERDISLVFQQYALYPHLSVAANIAYPLKVQRIGKRERDERVGRVADMLGLGALMGRKPGQLSGGEQQRVALGRAIVRQPRVSLMDEPLSNLDAKLRTQMRTEIKGLQKELGVTTFFVTHDQAEAMTLADRIAIMDHGHLQQVGSPEEVYAHPANTFVAEFIGSPPMNLLPATRDDRGIRAFGTWRMPVTVPAGQEGDLMVGLRPEDILLAPAETDETIFAKVHLVEPLGSEVIVNLRVGDHVVRVRVAPNARPRMGETVYLTPVASGVRIFDRTSGRAVGGVVPSRD